MLSTEVEPTIPRGRSQAHFLKCLAAQQLARTDLASPPSRLAFALYQSSEDQAAQLEAYRRPSVIWYSWTWRNQGNKHPKGAK